MLGANGDFASLNLFAYCGNNPVNRMDSAGYFLDLVLDILSLGMSIVEVVSNPKDPWAWAGFAGDVVDVVIPFAGGVGEITRGLKATANVTDAIGDTAEIADDVVDTSKSLKTLRTNAVRKAWKNEVDLVRTTGKGTRAWTIEEIDELLNTGKVKGYVCHHMKSVKGYPELAGDPLNIQFLTPKQHLLAHGGNWRNITDGRYLE